jgi:thiamine-phosphate pyrophosphorylase
VDARRRIRELDWSLVAIIDRAWLRDRPIQQVAEQIIRGGATIIQYRDKISEGRAFYMEASVLRNVTTAHRIPLIINDRVDIAMAMGADGVHLGQDDLPMEAARALVGENTILGGSVHDTGELATMEDADYLGVGAVYRTNSKEKAKVGGLELIKTIRSLTRKPMVGIGGITPENCGDVIAAGADGVAVISAVMDANDITSTVQRFIEKIGYARQVEV